MADEERRSSFYKKFGDPLNYSKYTPNPQFHMTRRLLPPSNKTDFSRNEYDEFLDYLQSLGIKMGSIFCDGQILITDLEIHGGHQAAVGAFASNVHTYDEMYSVGEHSVLKAAGQRISHYSRIAMMPDAQWVPAHGLAPSLVLEVGNTQDISILLTKVNTILNENDGSRYVVVVKLWRNPVPARVAMVIMVWRKFGDNVVPAEYEAIHFVSFGNRAPTAVELAGFPRVPNARGAWLPDLQGVVEDVVFSVPCNDVNVDHPLFNIKLHAQSMFSLPNDQSPQSHSLQTLPPLVIRLFRMKWKIVEMMVDDILLNLFHLSDADFQEIVDHQGTQTSYSSLYMFALKHIALKAQKVAL